MKVSEIKEMASNEIVERLQIEKENLVRLRLNHAVSPLENPNKLKETKATIARLNTILRERELNENQK
ncbi:LSU ribosomal protein L29P [Draconibacterium orientale]|uniref:Large ribosomal subunit protein uL29 n=1 Tax=Draconibacterium orientale TaxID=1168034 RepID=X5DI74_9BACT|nr:50S ribosomal protein L29 [Draconibacterium orientale]AHW60207.1 50S ribosomal protein L29 [Draconibacterium orientale]SES95952.1 LSU ribosomal protein L29P [Draconibacterium orientale]